MEAPHNGTLESRKRASANVRRPQRSRLLKKRERRGEERRRMREERRRKDTAECKARSALRGVETPVTHYGCPHCCLPALCSLGRPVCRPGALSPPGAAADPGGGCCAPWGLLPRRTQPDRGRGRGREQGGATPNHSGLAGEDSLLGGRVGAVNPSSPARESGLGERAFFRRSGSVDKEERIPGPHAVGGPRGPGTCGRNSRAACCSGGG
ncbi:uncharacterized protein LOC116558479 [Sapajus apella]|uniref:Uncharacterized protein LOC116558479 n=1 Tax=Sapajus apella TaxID=9515 RepID=A0A6J3IPH1_SAPAP|nr:uncharacterized protein LOC116558479 [Sapajus apella]